MDRFKGLDRCRNKVSDAFVIVRNRADNQNRDFAACQVLLVLYVLVNRDEKLILLFC